MQHQNLDAKLAPEVSERVARKIRKRQNILQGKLRHLELLFWLRGLCVLLFCRRLLLFCFRLLLFGLCWQHLHGKKADFQPQRERVFVVPRVHPDRDAAYEHKDRSDDSEDKPAAHCAVSFCSFSACGSREISSCA